MNAHINLKTVLSVTLLLVLSAPVLARPALSTNVKASQVSACVAAINDAADLSNAERVRHNVDSEPRRSTGHRLVIDTRVFGADGMLRAYRAVCVVASGSKPVSFVIEEVAATS